MNTVARVKLCMLQAMSRLQDVRGGVPVRDNSMEFVFTALESSRRTAFVAAMHVFHLIGTADA